MMVAELPGTPRGNIDLDLPESSRGSRLDQVLASLLPDHSRAALQRLIGKGRVRIANRPVRSSYRVRGGERVTIHVPEVTPSTMPAEDLPLEILHEDEDLIVLNKPPGLVVHPGAGVRRGTLANALLHHFRGLSSIGGVERPGIVHRLDRDTSGVMVVAKNDSTHRSLAAQFKARTMEKAYEALVWGRPRRSEGRIDAPIGRHPQRRMKMTIREGGRESRSGYRVLEALGSVSLVELRPETGRTHQLRVHLSHLGHPVVGDRTYGGSRTRTARTRLERAALDLYSGLALHARRLGLSHPGTGMQLAFEAPRPVQLEQLIMTLRNIRDEADNRTGGLV
jgi:23S rRNA pseudouridine1911/1915/1917 synthase